MGSKGTGGHVRRFVFNGVSSNWQAGMSFQGQPLNPTLSAYNVKKKVLSKVNVTRIRSYNSELVCSLAVGKLILYFH